MIATLVFEHTILMADFILQEQPTKIETDSLKLQLKGSLSEDQISVACLQFKAELVAEADEA